MFRPAHRLDPGLLFLLWKRAVGVVGARVDRRSEVERIFGHRERNAGSRPGGKNLANAGFGSGRILTAAGAYEMGFVLNAVPGSDLDH